MNKKYAEEIAALSQEINERANAWDLYYQRGYFYFLINEDDKARDDFKQAVSLGMDVTEFPYYAFSPSNSKRREFLLPEKILVFLILLMVIIALTIQITGFIAKIKGIF